MVATDLAELVDQARAGRARAIGRLVSLVESDRDLPALMALLAPDTGRARVIGLTGPPGVGKSTTVAGLVTALRARGERVAAFKPAVTGLDETGGEWAPDHELLAAATGQEPNDVTPYAFGPAVSPHWAAELAAAPIDPSVFMSCIGRRASGSARFTSGITTIASASFTTPRIPGRRAAARPPSSGLRPEATFTSPSSVRTAAAQCVGPCTSRPLRSAMPPSRSLSSGTGAVILQG